MSILLPTSFFVLAAWQTYKVEIREASGLVERTTRILQEHATKVFETQRLVLNQVNERLHYLNWNSESDLNELHQLLEGLHNNLEQVATITVTDAEGRLRASSRSYPFDTSQNFADRDWFQAVRDADMSLPFISRAYPGRQSGQPIFNAAERVFSASPGSFNGAIAVSADRTYFETFYRDVEPAFEHVVALVRDDGEILARFPATSITRVEAASSMLRRGRDAPEAVMRIRSSIDGVERLASYRRIGSYPVFVTFAIGLRSILAPWRRDLWSYGLVALVAAAVLMAVSILAIKRSQLEHAATLRWQDATARLRNEVVQRESIEQQLRQSQKMEAVGRLTGGVAHDFNNFLTVVIGSLDMLKRRLSASGTAHLRLLDSALEGANRAATMTHRLLAFSRQQPLAPEPVDANRLVAGLSDLLRRTLGERLELETVLSGGLWPTLVDPHQLESAMVNLAVNARDAMPEGGKLTIETANAYLDEAYAAMHPGVIPGQYVLVGVSDTGAGMSPDVIARAFEPFFTTKPVGQGTGLGLSQVYGFVRQSKGHCAIYSELGLGTTVKLYLPRMTQLIYAKPTGEHGTRQEPAGSRGETILVVEDEPLVRDLSVSILRDGGYKVLEAANGPSALSILEKQHDVEMLFTDVVLTGPLNGKQLAEAAKGLRDNLVILFTTGYARNAIIHHERLDEGTALISKPFTPEALMRAVRQSLDRREA